MKIFAFLVYLILLFNCCSGQQLYNEGDIILHKPNKKIKYKLAKKKFELKEDTTIISTNAVYVLSEYLCWSKCDSVYFFIRFFANGDVFVSFPYSGYPKIEEFNNLSYGNFGKYIIKDGKIIIELYQDRQHGVMFMYAKPIIDGLQFYATSYKLHSVIKDKTTEGGVYKKRYVNLYNWPK